jgi:hypothetical protein
MILVYWLYQQSILAKWPKIFGKEFRLQLQNSKMISALSNKWVIINEINAKIQRSPPVKNI